jgi:tRNA(Ile2)-agmatinylcytidine synthase
LYQLLQHLPSNVDVGTVRLVRLWPFAVQRTRGNAAVAVELKTDDEQQLLRFLDSYWSEFIQPLQGAIESSEHSSRQQYPSDPGMVWFKESVSNAGFYRKGLRAEIQLEELPNADKSWGGMGRIGATLAIHWPADSKTYEAIAWRMPDANGHRQLDEEAMNRIDQLEGTFLCRDNRLQSSLLAPRGNSPVLFGIRTWEKEVAKHAAQTLIEGKMTEPVSGWMIFETNQATNDHLDEPIECIVEDIETIKGGHTIIKSETHHFIAFRESGKLALLCQQLKPGDVIECMGLEAPDQSIHIEFLRIRHLQPLLHRPLCPVCNKSMASMGANQGIRCKKCGHISDDNWEEKERNLLLLVWIQPSPSSRRHLAKPLTADETRQNNI